MQRAIQLREQRREHWKTHGERSLWKNMSIIGVLGWLIVTPMLLGVLLGSWLDRLFESGIFYTGAMVFIGTVLGCYLAWQRIRED